MLEHAQLHCQCSGKICSICDQLLCLAFYSIRGDTGKFRSDCKKCCARSSREYYRRDPERIKERNKKRRKEYPELTRSIDRKHHYRTQYGLGIEEVHAILEKQEGRCAVCKIKDFMGPGKRHCVDHDHITGKIRGILCQRCNTAIGLMDDDPLRLQAACKYLENWKRSEDIA